MIILVDGDVIREAEVALTSTETLIQESSVEPIPVQVYFQEPNCEGDTRKQSHGVRTQPFKSIAGYDGEEGRFISPFYCEGLNAITYITQAQEDYGSGKGVVVTDQWVGEGQHNLSMGENVDIAALMSMLGVSAYQDQALDEINRLLKKFYDASGKFVIPIATSTVTDKLYKPGTKLTVRVESVPKLRRSLARLLKEKRKLLKQLNCTNNKKYRNILDDASEMIRNLRSPRERWNPRQDKNAASKLQDDVANMKERLRNIDPKPSVKVENPSSPTIVPKGQETVDLMIGHDCGRGAFKTPINPVSDAPGWVFRKTVASAPDTTPWSINGKQKQAKRADTYTVKLTVQDRTAGDRPGVGTAEEEFKITVKDVPPKIESLGDVKGAPGDKVKVSLTVSDDNAEDLGDEDIDINSVKSAALNNSPIIKNDKDIENGKATYSLDSSIKTPLKDKTYDLTVTTVYDEDGDSSDKEETADVDVTNVEPSVTVTTDPDAVAPGNTSKVNVSVRVEDENTVGDIETLTMEGKTTDTLEIRISPKKTQHKKPWGDSEDSQASKDYPAEFTVAALKKSDGWATVEVEADDGESSPKGHDVIVVEERQPFIRAVDYTYKPEPLCKGDPFGVQESVIDGNGEDDVSAAWADPSWRKRKPLNRGAAPDLWSGTLTAPDPGTHVIHFEATDGNTPRVRSGKPHPDPPDAGPHQGPLRLKVNPCRQMKARTGVVSAGGATSIGGRVSYLPRQLSFQHVRLGVTVGGGGQVGVVQEAAHGATAAKADSRISDRKKPPTKKRKTKGPVVSAGVIGEVQALGLAVPDASDTPWFADVNVQALTFQAEGNWAFGLGPGVEIGRTVAHPGSSLDAYITAEVIPLLEELGAADMINLFGAGVRYRF